MLQVFLSQILTQNDFDYLMISFFFFFFTLSHPKSVCIPFYPEYLGFRGQKDQTVKETRRREKREKQRQRECFFLSKQNPPVPKFFHIALQCLLTILIGSKSYKCFPRNPPRPVIMYMNAIFLV